MPSSLGELNYPFDPYRVKVVEKIKLTTREERRKVIESANFNLFMVKAEDVMIDLLTDSGTGAMSAQQCCGLLAGDESYAGSKSFFKFEKTVKDLTNFKFIYPVHQGRAAERILTEILCAPKKIVLSNGLFDTTRGNIEHHGSIGIDIPISESDDEFENFKGNISLRKLEDYLKIEQQNVAFVMITITLNGGGGQPVSLKNIRAASELCKSFNVPFFIDGCRFAENSYFIKKLEKECSTWSIKEIALKIFSLADGMTMSAKKDGISHIGGWIAVNDEILADGIRNLLILTEGFTTYGGLAGRDLEIIETGLQEVVDEDYLKHRIESVAYLGSELVKIGIPVLQPTGGHAIFIDAGEFLPHIHALEFPAQALAVELYIEGGIRSVEIGSLMFGLQTDGTEKKASKELLRLALPRRVYSKNHFDYIVQVMKRINDRKSSIIGFEMVKSSKILRHFTCHFKYKF